MTKKFLSIVLMMALVMSIFPVMGVQADAVAPVPKLVENFENFTAGSSFNDAFSGSGYVKDLDGNYRIYTGTNISAKIIEMVGYDGKMTQAVDLYTNSAITWSGKEGYARINYSGHDFPGTGAYVLEFKIYVPAMENDVERSFYRVYGGPIMIQNNQDVVSFGIGDGWATSQYDMFYTGTAGKWYKLTYVYEYGAYSSATHAAAASLYVDDQLVEYRYNTPGYKDGLGISTRLMINNRSNANGSEDVAKEHIIFDDFNFYVPGTTTTTSTLAGATNVNKSSDIKVDFNNMILNTEIDSEPTVSSDCVAMSDAAGNAVEIESVTVSADSKSLVINPKNDLAEGTEYSVAVSGLTDMYSQSIDSYSFTFKTTEPNPIVLTSAPSLKKVDPFTRGDNGTAISVLENGYIKANYTITNNHATSSKDAVMIVVLKDSGSISAFQFEEVSLAAGQSHTFNGAFDVKDASNQSVEFYVWDSISGKTDLVNSYKITASGSQTITTVQ